MVTSIQHWTYGRFEIRAALPSSKWLRTDIRLESAQSRNTPKGRINIVSNIKSQTITYGTQTGTPVIAQPNHNIYNTTENLQHYHTYTVDWNETHIQWFFDENHLNSLAVSNTTDTEYRDGPFHSSYKLVIELQLVGLESMNDTIILKWKDAKLKVKYVKVYQWRTLADYTNGVPIVTIIISVLFLILLLIVIYLWIRLKMLKRINRDSIQNPYDDCIDNDFHLETDDTYHEYNYCVPYSGINMPDVVDHNYLEMTYKSA